MMWQVRSLLGSYIGALFSVPAAPLPIHLPVIYLGKQRMMAQVLAPLSPMWDTRMEFPVLPLTLLSLSLGLA